VVTGELGLDAVVRAVQALAESGAGQGSFRMSVDPLPRATSKPLEPLWTVLDAAPAPSAPAPPSGPVLQGTLDVMDLAEVTQAVALGGKTGCLVVYLAPGEGAMVFETGRIVHAAFK